MNGRSRLRAVVLISGGGTNLQAFIDAVAEERLDVDLAAVISNRPGVGGLDRAIAARIPTDCIDHTTFEDRESFDAALADRIDACQPDVIILAGFMRILSPAFVHRFEGRILNIHPSLLPKFPGLDTHQRAIDAGEQWQLCLRNE